MTVDEGLLATVDLLRRDRRQDPCRGRREYSRAAREVADGCEQLIGAGEAARAVPLLRKAVDRMTRALIYLDDSSGIVGDDLRQIMTLYARACSLAPPKTISLAKWLVDLACDGPGWPRVLLPEFAGALGDRGMSEVARLVEERARTIDPESWTSVYSLRDLKEQLAEVSGDLDRYVAVLAENLTSGIQYERITHVLRAAGRRQDAITWARAVWPTNRAGCAPNSSATTSWPCSWPRRRSKMPSASVARNSRATRPAPPAGRFCGYQRTDRGR